MKAVVFHDVGDIRLEDVPDPVAAQAEEFKRELEAVAPVQHPDGPNWHPGLAPSQAQQWAVQALAKAGTLSIMDVYPPADTSFPIGSAMSKNLTIRTGQLQPPQVHPGPDRTGAYRRHRSDRHHHPARRHGIRDRCL